MVQAILKSTLLTPLLHYTSLFDNSHCGYLIILLTSKSANLISSRSSNLCTISFFVPHLGISLFTAACADKFLFSAAADNRLHWTGFETSGGARLTRYLRSISVNV